MVEIKVRTVSVTTAQDLNLGQKPREGENCPGKKGEVSTWQREKPVVAGELSVVLTTLRLD